MRSTRARALSTWVTPGAPISCASGLAVLDALAGRGLVDRVRERGPRLLADLRSALEGNPLVAEVRGRGFLLGVDLVDLPDDVHANERVEDVAFEHQLLVSSTHSTADGYAGDELVIAPAFTSTDEELVMMVGRFAEVLSEVSASLGGG